MARFAYYLPAFATDFSAAISLVSSIGGMSALHAPSGCMGNYCGFDEPDWIKSPGMTYCSMMREDETIFGNDGLLMERIKTACSAMAPPFVAIIGSPITALIGTDLQGIAVLSEQETAVPTVAVDSTGFGTYQDGLCKAFEACVDRFASEGGSERINVLGMDKYDYHTCTDRAFLEEMVPGKGNVSALVPGSDIGFFEGIKDSQASFAVSYAGLRMAELLRKRFGIPYEVMSYADSDESGRSSSRCLVIGDQVISNYIRDYIESKFGMETDVGTIFGMERSLAHSNDFATDLESKLKERISSGRYDAVICDPMISVMVPEGTAVIPVPHPAVSSKIHWNSFIPLARVTDYVGKALNRLSNGNVA
jgi:hypothetical protein